jgi:hypothetical protein
MFMKILKNKTPQWLKLFLAMFIVPLICLSGFSSAIYADDAVLFSEGFEVDTGAWVADLGIWQIGVPTNPNGPAPNAQGNRTHQGTGVLATGLANNYTDDRHSRMVSTAFVVPAVDQNPRLRFWHWWNFKSNDWGRVQISSDNGVTWKDLSTQYTADSSGQWTRATLDLNAYAGKTVRIGFYFESSSWGGTQTGPGWYIDEVLVVTGALPQSPSAGMETFEDAAAPDRWIADRGVWEIGVPTNPNGPAPNAQGSRAHQGIGVLATLLAGNYTDDRSSRVSSSSFVVPAADQNPRLRFWHWWSFKSNDWGRVQISSDNGLTWKDLSTQYTADSSGQWTRATLDLNVYAGKTVRIGFYFESSSWGGTQTGPGWYIDEIETLPAPVTTAPPTERDTILNNGASHVASWAYYTDPGSARWYISPVAASKVAVYSLGPMPNHKAGWWTVSDSAATINTVSNMIAIDPNLDTNSADTFYDVGIEQWLTNTQIHADRQKIQGTNVSIKWFFFNAPNAYWYIVNAPGNGSTTQILKFTESNGQYDWKQTDTADLVPVYSNAGNGKLNVMFKTK